MIKKVMKSILVIMLIISSVCIFSGCGKKKDNKNGKGEVSRDVYETPLKNYMEGLKTKNIELILSAYPDFMKTITQADLDAIYAKYEAMYGSNIVMEYKLGNAVRIENQSDLNILASQIKEYYPQAGDITVDDAYIITVELSVSGEGAGTEEAGDGNAEQANKKTDTQDFYVYKYNDNWYMF